MEQRRARGMLAAAAVIFGTLAPFVRGFMAPDGVFIASGIIDGREAEVAAALKAAGLEITAHHHEEEWHCFECR